MDEVSQDTRQVILKFTIQDNVASIQAPAGAKVLSCAWQDEAVQIWLLADPEIPKVNRTVLLHTTGHTVYGEKWEFCGTVIASKKRVFHVFLTLND
jgi:hypothetical protein